MNEYKKEEIRNIHYNNKNEIQFEYGGQVHHYRMENLKEVFVNCWNLQQENQKYKEVIDRAIEYVKEHRIKNPYHHEYNCFMGNAKAIDLLDILKEVE